MTSPYAHTGAINRVPRIKPKRQGKQHDLSHVPLRAHPWGAELAEHERRKRAMDEQAAPPAVCVQAGEGGT